MLLEVKFKNLFKAIFLSKNSNQTKKNLIFEIFKELDLEQSLKLHKHFNYLKRERHSICQTSNNFLMTF
jgi:hypothetical protein